MQCTVRTGAGDRATLSWLHSIPIRRDAGRGLQRQSEVCCRPGPARNYGRLEITD